MRYLPEEKWNAIQEDVTENSPDHSVRHTSRTNVFQYLQKSRGRNSLESERNHQKSDESRYSVTNIAPLDLQDTQMGLSVDDARTESLTYLRIIRVPTIVIAPPVAHGGIDEKMGPKKMETKNIIPVVMAVNPVLPPSVKVIYQPPSSKIRCTYR